MEMAGSTFGPLARPGELWMSMLKEKENENVVTQALWLVVRVGR